jgi:hypothetical protein
VPFFHYIALTNTSSLFFAMFYCSFLVFWLFNMSKNASIISKNAYLTNATNRDQNDTNCDHVLNNAINLIMGATNRDQWCTAEM